MIGETLSHYRIAGKLGEGGMGVVYRATDLKLDRNVALKVLSPHLASDADARSRFLREAKAAAALDHSNICMVHEVDEVDGQGLLAMQLIEGPTVKERIAERPLKLDEALDIAIQTARGLQAAHEKGVVHRDIKSANLMLTADGQVKIMDFGLARLADHTQITKTAAILGTPAYMSPEQARGQPADHRSDIFSLGVVIYEMVTGRLPFTGENDQSVLYAIINQEPEPPTALRTGLPTELDRIILKALAKDPEERYQHIDEMRADLNGLRRRHESASNVIVPATRSSRSLSLAKVAAVLAVGITLTALITWLLTGSRSRTPDHPGYQAISQLTTDSGLTYQPALSPDGDFLAYASDRDGGDNLDIWLQQIGGGSPIQLTNDPADDHQPAFSPDGKTVVFRSERDGGGIYVVPTLGGDAKLVAQDGLRPRFSPDGNHLALDGNGNRLYVTPSSGGQPRQIHQEFRRIGRPAWLPDGRLLFFGDQESVASRDWWVTSVEGSNAAPTGAGQTLREAGLTWDSMDEHGGRGVWSRSDSSLIFAALQGGSTNIWRLRMDPRTGRADGLPQRVTIGPGMHANPAISENGRLVFASLVLNYDIWSLPLDANRGRVVGELERLTTSVARERSPTVSDDGSQLAYASNKTGERRIWTMTLKDRKQRAFGPGTSPEISRDGSSVAYIGRELDDYSSVYTVSSNGGLAEKVREENCKPSGWSHDGRYLLCGGTGDDLSRSVLLLDLESRKETTLVSHPDRRTFEGRFSPDDNWVAFQSTELESALYVAPFRGPTGIPPDEWIVVASGMGFVDKPRWSPDGNLIYFTSDKDGRPCVYAQRLDPVTKHPVGDVLDIHHSHDARYSLRNVILHARDIDVARDKLILSMAELTGNIWMMEPAAE